MVRLLFSGRRMYVNGCVGVSRPILIKRRNARVGDSG